MHEFQGNSNSQGGHSNCMDECSLIECRTTYTFKVFITPNIIDQESLINNSLTWGTLNRKPSTSGAVLEFELLLNFACKIHQKPCF